MLEFIIIYGFVELMCMGNIIWYEFWWIKKCFVMNFIWKMMIMNLLMIKNEVQDNQKN
jgi:hypothetical protein